MMDLAKEVINELRAIDLNGANITNIECLTNETRIVFLIEGIEVFFTARNAVEYVITSIVYQEQVFDDPDVLSQYNAWVKYVVSKVHPIVESKRLEVAEVAYRANVETLLPEEHAIVGTGENVSTGRLEEAEARGRKEGFKAARKRNAKEMKALKNKYNMIITVIVVVLIAAFVAIWIFMGPETGGNTPSPLTQQEVAPQYEDTTATTAGETVDGEITDAGSELVNDAINTEEEAELAATLFELGEAFEFDNLEITFGTHIAWDAVENEFSEHNGAAGFRLPITITNLSEVAHGLNMFSYTQFSPIGERLDSISAFFDNDVDWSGDISPNETLETYMHFLFDRNGEYVIEFENSSERIKIVFDVQQES